MRSRPSNLLANHRVSERASLPLFYHPRSFFHPRAGREKGERFITAFIARRVLAARIAGRIGLWRLLNFDVTKSLFHSRPRLAPPHQRRRGTRARCVKADTGVAGAFDGTR